VWGCRGIAPLFLYIGTRCRRAINFTSSTLLPERVPSLPLCPLDGGLGGPRTSLDAVAKTRVCHPSRESSPGCPACSLVTVVTEPPGFPSTCLLGGKIHSSAAFPVVRWLCGAQSWPVVINKCGGQSVTSPHTRYKKRGDEVSDVTVLLEGTEFRRRIKLQVNGTQVL
jgi:hypothetical protein